MSGSFVNENEHFFYMLHKHIVNCCYFDFIENLNISLRWNMMNYNKSYRLLCRVIFSVIIIISTFQITHPSCLPPNLYTSNLFPCSNVSDVSLNILLLLILPFAFRKTTTNKQNLTMTCLYLCFLSLIQNNVAGPELFYLRNAILRSRVDSFKDAIEVLNAVFISAFYLFTVFSNSPKCLQVYHRKSI